MKKTLITVFILFIYNFTFSQNFLDNSTWQAGSGVPQGYVNKGSDMENSMELGTGPYGDQAILWKAIPDGTSGSDGDGGFDSKYVNIDHTKTYRLTVWIKKTNSVSGTTYFGTYTRDGNFAHSTLNLNGAAVGNAYLWYGDLPDLNQWYLLVGYVHHSGYNSTTSLGGIYDIHGTKLMNTREDFKFKIGADKLVNRAYLFYDSNVNDRQYFYGPRIEEVNGNEPTIEQLISTNINDNTNGNDISGVWLKNNNNIYYNKQGNVGIGTTNPDAKLTVKGNIHTQEVKVDLNGAVAPDYVFLEDYDLKTINEVEAYIQDQGHLPNIPSAAEMEQNGIELKQMNLNLLEKIEELTLYTIAQEKRIKELESRDVKIKTLEEKIELLLKGK
ncbi:tail fiber protein [Aquimarina sp. Aq107]|uniref:tail fiber protein n=1 Tax=Aquimarina sp. Aq107 TaxID=1191912 RepID=UPI0020B46193|nr:tail fiber protein [Aquimarina sp. Aq107]